jgi:lysozyme
MVARQISGTGFQLLQQLEGLRLLPYKDSGGLWTVGFGHLIVSEEKLPGVYFKSDGTAAGGISLTVAKALLSADLKRFENLVSSVVKVNLQQCEFDALVIFAFNIGLRAFKDSTLLKELNSPHSCASGKEAAALNMLGWCHVQNAVVPSLQLRQLKTIALFCGWQAPVRTN